MITSVGPCAGKGIDIGDDASRKQAGGLQDCPSRPNRNKMKRRERVFNTCSRRKGDRCSMPCEGMRAHIFNACRPSSPRLDTILDHRAWWLQRLISDSPKRRRQSLRGCGRRLQWPSHANSWVSSSHSHTPLLARLPSIFGSERALDSEPLAHHSALQSPSTSPPRYSSQILTLSALHPKIGFRTRASAYWNCSSLCWKLRL